MLTGKSALVTGSTQGIGLAIATRLAAQGCNVMLNGLGKPDEIEANRRVEQGAAGVRVLYRRCRSRRRRPGRAAGRAHDRRVRRHRHPGEQRGRALLRADRAVQAAGLGPALAVNLSSAFHTTRLALPGMRQRDFGRIVNMASIYGLRAVVNRVDYVTTKTAMIGFTRAVALETAGQNITCNALCPGSSPTPSIEQRFEAFMAKENLPRAEAEKVFMGSRQPSGRFVAADRIGGLVAFLCGPDGVDITGAAISIDGGWSTA